MAEFLLEVFGEALLELILELIKDIFCKIRSGR